MASVKTTVLPNGLTIITENRSLQTVTIALRVNVGSQNETEKENGITHFLEHMFFKRTKTRSSQDISSEIENLGGNINAYTSTENTTFIASTLPKNIKPTLAILADMMQNPVFDPEDIELERNSVLQELYEAEDDIRDRVFTTLSNVAFSDQALGRPILGSKTNIDSFTQKDLQAYYQQHYHAKNMTIVAIGWLNHKKFVRQIASRFASLPSLEASGTPPWRYIGGNVTDVADHYEQAQMILAFPIVGTNSGDYLKYDLLTDLYGTGTSSPLFQEVREKRGLCYTIDCGLYPHAENGLFIVDGSTKKENIVETLTIVCAELKKIANGEFSDTDWFRAQNQLKFQVVNNLDSVMGSINRIFSNYKLYGKVRNPMDTIEKIMKITKEDVSGAAKKMLDTFPTLIIAGSADPNENYHAVVSKSLL